MITYLILRLLLVCSSSELVCLIDRWRGEIRMRILQAPIISLRRLASVRLSWSSFRSFFSVESCSLLLSYRIIGIRNVKFSQSNTLLFSAQRVQSLVIASSSRRHRLRCQCWTLLREKIKIEWGQKKGQRNQKFNLLELAGDNPLSFFRGRNRGRDYVVHKFSFLCKRMHKISFLCQRMHEIERSRAGVIFFE